MTELEPHAAAWIRDVVLPPKYLANTGDPAVCPCQWGPSGHCQSGQHGKCPRTWGWERHGQPAPETHICDSRGMVVGRYGITNQVWRAGRACRWLCPCDCHEQVQALFPAPPRQAGRPSTTGGNGHGRIASTDRLRVFDDPQPTLLELAP